MKDSPMTWADTSNFTWEELQYFKWCDLALEKLELLKKVYSENEPLPPQVYERLKCYCDGKITYICNRLKTIAEVTPAVINLASTIQDALPRIPQ